MGPNSVTYDGNGNVIGLVDMATGVKSATYDYNAFGETIQSDGVAAVANHFRFSTKYTDDETGLLYYGLRYYNPSSGRWLSRDPIEESGGMNLTAFCWNAPISAVDRLGLDPITAATLATQATTGSSAVAGGSGVSGAAASANAGISGGEGLVGGNGAFWGGGAESLEGLGPVVGEAGVLAGVLPLLPFSMAGGQQPPAFPAKPATSLGTDGRSDPNNSPYAPIVGPSNKNRGSLNAMRLQLQKKTANIWSDVAVAPPKTGVGVWQIRVMLLAMNLGVDSSSNFPAQCKPALKKAIIQMSQKVGLFPPGGVVFGGNVARETFQCDCDNYRIDLENLRGHNLRY